jgi:multidrug efflux pump subunit AcrB
MTLGGLALAVGILVDDATVEIENVNRILEEGHETNIKQAILDGAQQIAVPALVSTLCICIVFMPLFLLGGVARYLFVPLAEAVVFAMLASYILSRTLVPTLAMYMLRLNEDQGDPRNVFSRFQKGFEAGFERVRAFYHDLLSSCPLVGAGLLSADRQRPVHSAYPGQDRNAHRGDRSAIGSR